MLLALAALVASGCEGFVVHAQAQESPGAVAMPEGGGLVFVGAIGKGQVQCYGVGFILRPVPNPTKISISLRGTVYSRFTNPTGFEPKGLAAGQYIIASVTCDRGNLPGGATTFPGPFAKFQVRAGEVVDVGMLQIDYTNENALTVFTGRGKINLSIEPTNEMRLAEARKTFPLVMNKLVNRPMVITGPAERQVKRRGSL
jgi:hypothetical protein